MANYKLDWLADALRAAKVPVVELDGWKTRGHGDFGTARGVLLHHTAGALKGDHPSRDLVVKGRPDLAGPLCNLYLSRSGVFYTVAAGRAYHAGAGAWRGVTNTGNSTLIGIEAENTGETAGPNAEPWLPIIYGAYVAGVAALLKHLGMNAECAIGHKEYSPGRKIDPSFDMAAFRAAVATRLATGS